MYFYFNFKKKIVSNYIRFHYLIKNKKTIKKVTLKVISIEMYEINQ